MSSHQRPFKSQAPQSQQSQSAMDPARRLRQLLGVERRREWLTIAQLAVHGKFMSRDGEIFSPEAARKFVTRHPALPRGRRGRQILVDRDVFDAFVMSLQQQKSA